MIMDQMELEDDKSLVMAPRAKPGISDNLTTNDKNNRVEVSSIKQESPTILRASNMTSLTSSPSSTTSSISGVLTSLASNLSTNASPIGNTSPGLFSAKQAIIKPSSLLGISGGSKNVVNIFAASKTSASLCPTVNTSPTHGNNIFASKTVDGKSSASPLPTNPTTLWSGSSKRGLNTPQAFGSDPAIPGTSSLHIQVSEAGGNHSDGGSSSRIGGGASIPLHGTFLQAKNAGNLDFSTWRKSASPTRGSRRPEMKRGMKGKHLKQLHHQIHYLKSYLTSYGTTRDLMNQDNVGVGNQSVELSTFRDGILPGDASAMQSRMAKILKRKLRQRRSIERNLMYRGLINGNSSSNRNSELLEPNSDRNSTNPELSAPGANAITSSTSNMNTSDADACFFKSILPDMKTLNDARKLQFKFHIMGKLSELIAEQRRDSDSSNSEQRRPQGLGTSQQVSSIEEDPGVSMQSEPVFSPGIKPFHM